LSDSPLTPEELLAGELVSLCRSRNSGILSCWREIWLSNIRANKERFGLFRDRSIGQIWGRARNTPAVCVGSGPSLAKNIGDLWRAKEQGIPLLSCLHNYQMLEDRGIKPDYYVTTDGGSVVVDDMVLGGRLTPAEYFASTKDKTLLAYIGTHPSLFDHWQGNVLFYNCPLESTESRSFDLEVAEIEPFYAHVSAGGNVLGASVYIAKAIMGANPIALVGADFSYSPEGNFYPQAVNQEIEGLGPLRSSSVPNIYGVPVNTTEAYYGFKVWFDWVATSVRGQLINCTEGGIFGAYPDGQLSSVPVVPLAQFFANYRTHELTYSQACDPTLVSRFVAF
jgi:hypothetical protein